MKKEIVICVLFTYFRTIIQQKCCLLSQLCCLCWCQLCFPAVESTKRLFNVKTLTTVFKYLYLRVK